jgi:superfamily II DNA or RNA helicase
MKTLFPAQEKAVKLLVSSIIERGSALNSSCTGSGKTVMACAVARKLHCPVAVIAPKATLPSWKRELAEWGIEPIFVTNYEKIRNGSAHLKKPSKKIMKWVLPEGTLLIMDEVHRAQNPWTQNSQLLISAKMQGIKTLLLSATAAEDPTEMRAIGYALDLHGLNRGTELLPSWDKWMKSFGCFQDQWKNWRPGPVKKLEPLHDRLYRDRAVRITERDLPEAFRENWVLEDPIEFGAVSKIKKFYEDAGVTTEVIDELMDHMDTFDKEDRAKARDKDAKVTMLLTRMLRARQLTEALKVPDIVEMTKDMIEEHKSVVIFVNFRETLDALVPALEATLKMEVGFVNGGQNAEERQDYVDRFRDDKLRVIVLNSEAGGTGIDGLQDTHGKFPRVSLISLSFNAKTFKQVLGRIHRANSKSDALQKILVASGTIEEYVLQAIHKKLSNLEALHGT